MTNIRTRPRQTRTDDDGKVHRHVSARREARSRSTRSSRSSDVSVYYGDYEAVRGVDLQVGHNEITAMIGPSGCGKSTVLRCFNRMNDLVPGARVKGKITYHGQDLYADDVDPIEVRRRIGMVFQKPNPFPKSIYDNVAYGPRVNGIKKGNMDDMVEEALTGAALWDEVKDKLKESAPGPLRRPAAAALHRPHDRGAARGDPHGRAVLGARPDRHRPDRGPDARPGARVHDHHRHAQHAAGRAGLRPHRVLHRRRRRARPNGTGGWSSSTDVTIFTNPSDKRTEDYITGRFG